MKNGDDIASLSPILGFDRRGQFLFVSFTEFRLEIIMPFEGGNRTEPFLDGRANLGEAGEQVTQNMIPIADPVVGIASSVTEVLDPGVSRGFGRDGVGLAERDPKAAGEDRREQSARIATQQQEDGTSGGLLEGLQKGIGRLGIHSFRPDENKHLEQSPMGFEMDSFQNVSDLLDGDHSRL